MRHPSYSCHDGFCGAEDCTRCHPGHGCHDPYCECEDCNRRGDLAEDAWEARAEARKDDPC